MKKLELSYLILFFAILVSCSGNKDKSKGNFEREKFISQVMNPEYLNSKSIFSDKMLSHFPDSLGNDYITHTETISPEAGIVRLDLTIVAPTNDDLKEILDKSIAVYDSEDTCMLVANRFAVQEKYGAISKEIFDEKKIDMECYEGLFPVPNFWQSDFYSKSTECKLKKGFKIYVIDSKPGIYTDEKYLSSNPYLPKKWEHGFSKGIAISESEKVAIYWVIVW